MSEEQKQALEKWVLSSNNPNFNAAFVQYFGSRSFYPDPDRDKIRIQVHEKTL